MKSYNVLRNCIGNFTNEFIPSYCITVKIRIMETQNDYFPDGCAQANHYPLAADSTGFGDPDWTRWLDTTKETKITTDEDETLNRS